MTSHVWQHLLIFALLYVPIALYVRHKRVARKLQVGLFLALLGPTAVFLMLDFGLLPSLDNSDDRAFVLVMLMSYVLALAVLGYCCYRVRSPWAFALSAVCATLVHSYSFLTDLARARGASEAAIVTLGNLILAATIALGLVSMILAFRAYLIRKASGDRI